MDLGSPLEIIEVERADSPLAFPASPAHEREREPSPLLNPAYLNTLKNQLLAGKVYPGNFSPHTSPPLPLSFRRDPIRAWRGFRVTLCEDDIIHRPMVSVLPSDYRLASLVGEYMYEGPVARNAGPPTADVWHSENKYDHGFYAVKKAHLKYVLLGYHVDFLAEVDLFGTVIAHENGYRAQGLVTRKLYVEQGDYSTSALRALEDRYQCEIERVEGKFSERFSMAYGVYPSLGEDI